MKSDTRDIQMGEKVTAARKASGLSRNKVADEMTGMGHETWSRATLRTVEMGERPLRATEAADLGMILGCDLLGFMDQLTGGYEPAAIKTEYNKVMEAAQRLNEAATQISESYTRLEGRRCQSADMDAIRRKLAAIASLLLQTDVRTFDTRGIPDQSELAVDTSIDATAADLTDEERHIITSRLNPAHGIQALIRNMKHGEEVAGLGVFEGVRAAAKEQQLAQDALLAESEAQNAQRRQPGNAGGGEE